MTNKKQKIRFIDLNELEHKIEWLIEIKPTSNFPYEVQRAIDELQDLFVQLSDSSKTKELLSQIYDKGIEAKVEEMNSCGMISTDVMRENYINNIIS